MRSGVESEAEKRNNTMMGILPGHLRNQAALPAKARHSRRLNVTVERRLRIFGSFQALCTLKRTEVRAPAKALSGHITQLYRSVGIGLIPASLLSAILLCPVSSGAQAPAAARFQKDIQPILSEYCYDCHGDGAKKGGVSLDEFKSDESLLNHDLWWKVLKNVRAGIMPPEKKPKPSLEQKRQLEQWIKADAFGADPQNLDPGRITVRRLNRVEYHNTIRDLMGYDYKVEEELPPDDSGYGFDNIGDVLTISPLLLEKYMQAAETITAAAVPRTTRVVEERVISGSEFHKAEGKGSGEKLTFYEEASVVHALETKDAGDYRFGIDFEVAGQFDFDPGRCRVIFKADDRELLRQEFGWQNGKRFHFDVNEHWSAGQHHLTFELQPLTPVEKKVNSLDLKISTVRVQGPLDEKYWVRPKHFELFFTQDVPKDPAKRREYARDVLRRFAGRAYRRPVDDRTVERLAGIAEGVYTQAGKCFEDGIAQAMVPVLASPRFLFRIEETESSDPAGKYPKVDEYSLASRLSYFLWSTMPDNELLHLAGRGELRSNLPGQIKRMLADKRSEALVQNFVGQWLQVRDVEGIDINARAVLARDSGQEKELERQRKEFLAQLAKQKESQTNQTGLASTNQTKSANQAARRFFKRPTVELDRELRRALREETEMSFAYVLREDRSLLELIDSDYTFLNERLAKHYGITNVVGNEMRRVSLPKDSPRGGVLTQGSTLIVTSNPTRTSPVKRGLFILDNILGSPPPPPPPDIPLLEEAEKSFADHEPTLREVLELHRNKPLCSSCHSRMDPLGFALENFNALGMWREKERNQTIDAAGRLITGESFHDIREAKHVLVTEHRLDFYRCFTEKLLTYALGRGLEYYDVPTVDAIVERLDRENGHFSALLAGIIESAPFQKRRDQNGLTPPPSPKRAEEQRADLK